MADNEETKVNFYSGLGLRLAGMLRLPDDYNEGSEYPGIVLCHGPGGARHPDLMARDTTMIRASQWLAKEGYVVLRFYYRGVGESEGPEYRVMPHEQVEDIQSAVTFLQQQLAVDASQIGIFGLATGGAHASYVAGIDDRIKCIVSVNGMGDFARWMRSMRRYWEWSDFLKMLDEDRVARMLTGKSRLVDAVEIILHDPATQERGKTRAKKMVFKNLLSLESADALSHYRPESVVGDISPRAAMWIGAKNDALVPNEEPLSMYQKAGQPKKLALLDGETHYSLYTSGLDRVMTLTTNWFNSHMHNS